MNFIEAMVMAGVYPADVRVQVVGESKVAPLSQAVTKVQSLPTESQSPQAVSHGSDRQATAEALANRGLSPDQVAIVKTLPYEDKRVARRAFRSLNTELARSKESFDRIILDSGNQGQPMCVHRDSTGKIILTVHLKALLAATIHSAASDLLVADIFREQLQRANSLQPFRKGAGNSSISRALPVKTTSIEAKIAWVVGAIGTLVLFGIIVEVSSSKPTSSDSLTPTPRSSATTTLTSSSPRPQLTTSEPTTPAIAEAVYNPSPPTPSYTPSASTYSPTVGSNLFVQPTSEDSKIYRDASGRTYRVPNAVYYRLLTMKSALEAKKQNLDSEESQLESLARALDRDRIYLDRSSQYAVDAFNRKVNRLNSLNDYLQSLVSDYNRDVNAFNAELERVGTPIR